MIDSAELLRVAADAKVDPRTVRSALEGKARSRATREAIAVALLARGHETEASNVRDGKSCM